MEFLLALLVLLLYAKVFGELLHHIGFSPIIGEVAAGILLGPALLGLVTTSDAIYGVAMLGLVVLMLVTGMNSRFDLLMKVKFKAFMIAVSGVAVSFVLGFGVAYAWTQQLLPSLFVAAALSNTATEITVRVTERSRHRDVVVGAALIDDVLAVYILGILSTATIKQTLGQPLDFSVILWATLGIIAFFVLVGYLSRELIIKRNIMRNLWKFEARGIPLAFAICLALALAVIAQYIGLHAVIGAYMAGLFIGRLRERPTVTLQSRIRLNKMLDSITNSLQSILTPMFFVFVGLSFGINPATRELLSLGQVNVIVLLALIGAAFAGKLIGCGAGAAAVGYRKRDLAEIGTAMCARGSLELAVLQFGLLSGVVGSELFAVMVVTTLSTTLLTPVIFKYVSKT
ncbi:MAG: cation:proton antiporter [Candidatus Hodarchaeaceae archaeon]|nr:cation:proton antiporter [Candidatus Hodarchaeaceae archaeon]